MHFKAIPNKNNLVIFKSQGKFTNILPSAVILEVHYLSLLLGGFIVSAPVPCKFLIAF